MATTAKYDGFDLKDKQNQNIQNEMKCIEAELKDWFLTRRLKAERAIAFKRKFDQENFTGLSVNNNNVPTAQAQLWKDIVHGKPDLEDSLSGDAKIRKAERYANIFETATDHTHSCRAPGALFFRCLQDNANTTQKERDSKCLSFFGSFDACRTAAYHQQEAAYKNSIIKQDIEDSRAKFLFARRNQLLFEFSGEKN